MVTEPILPTTTAEAFALAKQGLQNWRTDWIVTSRVALDEARVRETSLGWWVPLGAGTARYPTPNLGDEAYVVVTRDGSRNGWYISTTTPLWWNDGDRRRSWLGRLLGRGAPA